MYFEDCIHESEWDEMQNYQFNLNAIKNENRIRNGASLMRALYDGEANAHDAENEIVVSDDLNRMIIEKLLTGTTLMPNAMLL